LTEHYNKPINFWNCVSVSWFLVNPVYFFPLSLRYLERLSVLSVLEWLKAKISIGSFTSFKFLLKDNFFPVPQVTLIIPLWPLRLGNYLNVTFGNSLTI
jgi:hypothetical protein